MGRLPKRTSGVLLASVVLASVLGVVRVAAALAIGEQAPDFTLPSTTGEKITLSQFQGKHLVLIEFYVGESST